MNIQEAPRDGYVELKLLVDQEGFHDARRLQNRLASPNLATAYVNAEHLVNTLADRQEAGWGLQLVRNIRRLTVLGWQIQIARRANIKSVRLPTEQP